MGSNLDEPRGGLLVGWVSVLKGWSNQGWEFLMTKYFRKLKPRGGLDFATQQRLVEG